MQGLDTFDDQDDGTIFRDVIMLTLLGFVTIVVLLLPHLNPPVKAENSPAAGNLIIQVTWPAEMNTDVDLWVRAPDDNPVGYSAKGGKVFNLLRDDIGNTSANDRTNFEFAFSRGTPAGEYVVNLHLYADHSKRLPVDAVVDISRKDDTTGEISRIATKTIRLVHVGEEITALRFKLDAKGKLVPDSLHDLPLPLRTASTR